MSKHVASANLHILIFYFVSMNAVVLKIMTWIDLCDLDPSIDSHICCFILVSKSAFYLSLNCNTVDDVDSRLVSVLWS